MVYFWSLAMATAMATAMAMAMATAMAMAAAAAAAAVIRPEYAYRGRPPRKSTFFIKNTILNLFWSFLDLLNLKNGSGSKFYAEM